MNESYKLYFNKIAYGGDYHFQEENLTIPDCSIYSVKDSETLLGQFFTGVGISYAHFGETKILIQEYIKLFQRSKYYVRDFQSKKELAFLHISDSIWFGRQSASVTIPAQSTFRWESRSDQVIRFFQPKTWNHFYTCLGNGSEEILFNGQILYPTFTKKITIPLSLTGEICMNKQCSFLLLTCGLYLLEQEIRLKDME